jgi:hypothetical protein
MSSLDPDGKRRSRLKAALLEESLVLLHHVKSRLESADSTHLSTVLELLRDLRREAQGERSRAEGHLAPRKKYKGRSPHLALESGRGLISLYLDESGKDNVSLEQPIFVLAGVALSDADSEDFMKKSNQLKRDYHLPIETTLHASKIEKCIRPFDFEGNVERHAQFRESVRELVRQTPCVLVASIIRKVELDRFSKSNEATLNLPPDLYEMALTLVAERFVDFLYSDNTLKPCGKLVFESIGSLEDAKHQRAFSELLISGSEFVSDGCFRGWLQPGCDFRPKSGSSPLELADQAGRSMLQWARSNFSMDHEFLRDWSQKIHVRDDGLQGKFGVKVFPDDDIRQKVLEIRRQCLKGRDEA